MSDMRKLTGGLAAVLVLGAAGFIGLYIMIQRVASRLQDDPGVGVGSAEGQGAPAGAEAWRTSAGPAGTAPAGGAGSAPGVGSPVGQESQGASAPLAPGDTAAMPADSTGGSPPSAAHLLAAPGGDSAPSPATGGEGGATAAPAAAAPEPEAIDLSLDEPTLVKFLEVRRRVFEVFGPNRIQFALLGDDLGYTRRSKQALQRMGLVLSLRKVRDEGIAAVGLSPQEYGRVAKVLYEYWWRATAAGVDIPARISETRRQLAEVEAKLKEPALGQVGRRRFEAEKKGLEREIGRLEWSRSYPARQLLARIPAATQRVCEKHAAEVDQYAMPEFDMLTF